jgi:hypothetical protein
MSEPAGVLNRMVSAEEFLRLEMQNPTRHEFVAGQIYARPA